MYSLMYSVVGCLVMELVELVELVMELVRMVLWNSITAYFSRIYHLFSHRDCRVTPYNAIIGARVRGPQV